MKTIALIAHDGKKAEMVTFVKNNRNLLKKFRLDPATASAPFVATLVDVSGLVIYFTVATLILTGIML